MNLAKLKAAEKQFIRTYPGGFLHPEMVKIGKKHRMPQMTELCQQVLSKEVCRQVQDTFDNLIKIVRELLSFHTSLFYSQPEGPGTFST